MLYLIAGNGAEFAPGLFYTALTRVRRLQDIAFFPRLPSLTMLNCRKSNDLLAKEDEKKTKLANTLVERLTSGEEPTGDYINN